MDLDAETIQELSCKSSWDCWEFAVVIRQLELEEREASRERVAEWRRYNRAGAREARRRQRQRYLANRVAVNAQRRAAHAADPVAQAKEREKWQRRKARMQAAKVARLQQAANDGDASRASNAA